MAEARLESEWDRTSQLLALLANANRDPKKHGPFKASDFHPFRRRAIGGGMRITSENIGMLKKVFVNGGRKA